MREKKTNISKFYLTFKPIKWPVVHTNLRLFWGLKGREMIYGPEEAEGFQYWSIQSGKLSNIISVPKKWNASVHFFLSHGFELSFLMHDIIDVDSRKGTRDKNRKVINTLRWQQIAESDHKGLSSKDQRSFGIRVAKKF